MTARAVAWEAWSSDARELSSGGTWGVILERSAESAGGLTSSSVRWERPGKA